MYARGQGLPKNYREAERWFRLAAEQGDATAQANLGLLYANGYGLPRDYVQAYIWFSRAGAQGHTEALELCSIVASKMTSRQIAEAEKLANESRAKE
jgi:TPR repeat protein